MHLYKINKNLQDLWDKVIEQDGELTEEDIKAFEELSLVKDEKLKGYGVVIRETETRLATVKNEIARLKKLENTMQRKADWLTDRLSEFMLENNIPEFKSVEVNITFRKSSKLEIEEETKLAKKWLKIKTEIDRQAIKDFINAGGKVKGCEIVEKQNIQIK